MPNAAEMTVRLGATERSLLEAARKNGRLPDSAPTYIRDEKAAIKKLVDKTLMRDIGSVLFLTDAGQARADAEHLKAAAAKAPAP